jgi:hypothetical protein
MLIAALRASCRLNSGDRVATVAKNCVAYLERLYGTRVMNIMGVQPLLAAMRA